MTNTLHRYGDAESLRNDFIVFAIPSRGYNDRDCVPKLRQFLRMALKYKPVNLGDGSRGGIFRPSKKLNPLAHWFRKAKPDFEEVVEKVSSPTPVAAVFDNREAVERFVEELRGADLGISINISARIDGAVECCRGAGLARHSVEYSLGFMATQGLEPAKVLHVVDSLIAQNPKSKYLDLCSGVYIATLGKQGGLAKQLEGAAKIVAGRPDQEEALLTLVEGYANKSPKPG